MSVPLSKKLKLQFLSLPLLAILVLSPLATVAAANVITFTSPPDNSTLSGHQVYIIRGTISPITLPDSVFIQVSKQGSPGSLDAQTVPLGINGTFIYKTNVGASSSWTSGTYLISATDSSGAFATTTFTYAVNSTTTDSTSTTVSPSPVIVPAGINIQYTATVTDTSNSPSSPSGSVSWSDGGAGGLFNGTSTSNCALSPAGSSVGSRTILYSPSGAGGFTIKANYVGDSKHAGSSGTASLNITQHPTSISVSPSPTTVAAGGMVTLTATVTDGSTIAAPTVPSGNVSWSDGGAGGSFNSGVCKFGATGNGPNSASCQVAYTAPSAAGSVTVSASYSGDSVHAPSKGTSALTVSASTTSSSSSTSSTTSSSSLSSTSSTSTTTSSSTNSSTTSTSSAQTSPGSTTSSTSVATSSSRTSSTTTTPSTSTSIPSTTSTSSSSSVSPYFALVVAAVATLTAISITSGRKRSRQGDRGLHDLRSR